ncbi:hypothetical protein PoB_004173800 [Plakobranchus ocellatus]|uniref:Uncharacterized protein n=1 Tax=Plakobranchus ocellatus TaxID=259542 RepID=A0AAV4B6K0_9GAST|nr:hypothetical protein PoB_004173800 [Plakobranchus ocellatus]
MKSLWCKIGNPSKNVFKNKVSLYSHEHNVPTDDQINCSAMTAIIILARMVASFMGKLQDSGWSVGHGTAKGQSGQTVGRSCWSSLGQRDAEDAREQKGIYCVSLIIFRCRPTFCLGPWWIVNPPRDLQEPFYDGFEPRDQRPGLEEDLKLEIILLWTGCLQIQFPSASILDASPQQGDLRLSSPRSGQGAGSGALTRYRGISADIRADSLATVPPTRERKKERKN